MRFRSSNAMLAYITAVAALVSLGLQACSSDSGGKNDPPQNNPGDAGNPQPTKDGGVPASCTTVVEAPTVCPDPKPRYADVEPIFNKRCVSVCHSGTKPGIWSLADYGHVVDWADTIRSELLDCAMPPPDASAGFTKEEKLAILTWLRCDHPR
ncbi:hypothetical protein [Pendulispora albinea]|uniref:Cytochrome c domain-containing protein n=1 Tax=Pendulispora albinea TaxID=2741071 RepID=A0ABZ2M5V0_9BACT